MNYEQFQRLADQGYNWIPMTSEVLADLDTPLSAYLKLADDKPYSYLFESVEGGEKWGRLSIIGLGCQSILSITGNQITIEHPGESSLSYTSDDPLAEVDAFKNRYKVPVLDDLPPFSGGLVGYFGYDTVRYVEPRLQHSTPIDTLNTPDILLIASLDVLVFDNLKGKIILITHAAPESPCSEKAYRQAKAKLDQWTKQLHQSVTPRTARAKRQLQPEHFHTSFAQSSYENAVNKIKEYILDGDVMQVVLSSRLECDFYAPPLDLYRALRHLNPSPYLYFLNLEHFYIVGSSPEILVRVEQRQVTVRPLAGTRKRGLTEAQDKALEQELMNDPKEIAEHLMLIDLGRNDVGRVSQVGSVTVTDQMVVERYSHVMHIASNIISILKDECSSLDALRATLPVGTLSGAPKIRAMEILDELEPVKRGIYGGAVGYLSFTDNMDMAIAIRTAIIKQQKLYLQTGAGIVADSIPEQEWQECVNKAQAVLKALIMAENNLQLDDD